MDFNNMNSDKKKDIILLNLLKMLNNRGIINTLDKTQLEPLENSIYRINTKDGVYFVKVLNGKLLSLSKNANVINFLDTYKDYHKILIVQEINSKSKHTVQQTYKDTEIFEENFLIINIVDHPIVPQHILLSEEEGESILANFYARKREFPKILITDPIAMYYNMPLGRICKIIRKSETGGDSVFYRLVSPPKS